MEATVKKDYQVRCTQRTEIELSDEVKAIDKKLALEPKNADFWMERGLALAGQRLMREAVEAYSKAISLDPFKGIYYTGTSLAGNFRRPVRTSRWPLGLSRRTGMFGITWDCPIICWESMRRLFRPTAAAWRLRKLMDR